MNMKNPALSIASQNIEERIGNNMENRKSTGKGKNASGRRKEYQSGNRTKQQDESKVKSTGKATNKPASRTATKTSTRPAKLADKRAKRPVKIKSKPAINPAAIDNDKEYAHEDANIICGRHPVLEALKAERTIDKLIVGQGTEGSIIKIIGIAKDRGIPIHYSEKPAMDRMSGGGVHQGVIAYVSAYEYSELDDVFALAAMKGEEPFVVILDNLEDPHNLGAIIRSAEGAGAHGVIIPKRRAAGITETVVKASAGAIEYVPVVKVPNIAEAIEELKERGLWIGACDMGGTVYSKQNLKGAVGIVVGSEGSGVGRLIRERCDFIVSIPMKGRINSLNASNAAAIILYEIRRQRDEGAV